MRNIAKGYTYINARARSLPLNAYGNERTCIGLWRPSVQYSLPRVPLPSTFFGLNIIYRLTTCFKPLSCRYISLDISVPAEPATELTRPHPTCQDRRRPAEKKAASSPCSWTSTDEATASAPTSNSTPAVSRGRFPYKEAN